MSLSITTTLVINGDQIDQAASTAAFHTNLVKLVAERETQTEQIRDAVEALFDQYRGTSINMPAIASMTCQHLNAQPETFKVLSERVLAYVRENAQGKALPDGTYERPDSLFVIEKGKGGGCYRRADHVAKVESTK